MKTSTRSTMLFALVLACGPSVGKPSGEGSGSGGSESTTAAASVSSSSTSTTTTGVDTTTGDPGSSSTGESVPAACVEAGWVTSVDAFRTLVGQVPGQYWYSSRHAVYYSGFSPDCWYTTTVAVEGDVVIRRILSEPELARGGDPSACTEPPFDEMGADVGAHDTTIAGPPWQLDELYDRCCEDILAIEPADEYDITFSTFDNGVIRSCYAFEHNCADGCDFGPEGFGTNGLEEFGLGPLP